MRLLLIITAVLLCSCSHLPERNFEFNYKVSLPANSAQNIKIWIPIPTSNKVQNISELSIDTDLEYEMKKEQKNGNTYLYSAINGGLAKPTDINIRFRVNRKQMGNIDIEEINQSNALNSNRLVPVGGRFDSIIGANAFSSKDMKAVYNFVLNEMHYGKPKAKNESDSYYTSLPDVIKNGITKDSVVNLYERSKEYGGEYTFGNGNANYACDISVGNCTDFHSYFMSLSRSLHVPARFHIGFSIPLGNEGNIEGYHCWADFSQNNNTWTPVDISEADKDAGKAEYYFGNLDENRVEFTQGRDLELENYKNGLVNFFIYPLLEEDGKTSANYSKEFSFKEI
ncbi:transglutaminase-like domain-containing protein [Labilibaculum sp.]|uniref:transglutaminase-like domain-containing protein n=1 Tax=Labilibaculum sp. TaxID=2060723 RepID=UPI002AA73D92|nr:transglutaminase-like domain-containing protein [Labilibaculum sp.]MBN2598463.1 transglutaminase domain-containing protein [Marinifilaceae bacterium]